MPGSSGTLRPVLASVQDSGKKVSGVGIYLSAVIPDVHSITIDPSVFGGGGGRVGCGSYHPYTFRAWVSSKPACSVKIILKHRANPALKSHVVIRSWG